MKEPEWDPKWGTIQPPPKPDWEMNLFGATYLLWGKVSWFRRKASEVILKVKWKKLKEPL